MLQLGDISLAQHKNEEKRKNYLDLFKGNCGLNKQDLGS